MKSMKIDNDADEDDDDESKEVPSKKRTIFVKMFAHEKKKNNKDKEIGMKNGVNVTKNREK
ncbi:hypothetical protein TcasGA2_TC003993 [Tribolium castaneum]|uniref:Uncharacterized protein n=1 Tax=Tribolium castaneum TaxID=7070 RepID=D6WIG2_TRICA|nr:hypothetical protein TcasGA2_TC003993 [Tribolium castaneum]